MEDLIDFTEDDRVVGKTYLGNAGTKRGYLHDGNVWMVKFPQSTRSFKGKHLPSYTSSPISEYIGSKIYELAGIPVHETVLARYENKIVVGCKDFTANGADLSTFHGIKNTVDEELIEGSFGSDSRGERLSDVLRVIENAADFEGLREKAYERFWDMFVVDAFIRNNDRNNGNWGILSTRYTKDLAPVFDNGNAFFAKRNASLAEQRLADQALIEEDIKTGVSFFTDDNDKHIHALDYIASMQNPECNAALLRFAENINMAEVRTLIESIPEEAFGLEVLSASQKKFYIELLETTYEERFKPAIEELKMRERNKNQG